jgi:hypothetical protein
VERFLQQLFQTMVDTRANRLIMHSGERPYLATGNSDVDLGSTALTVDALGAIVNALVPADQRAALDELGAVLYEMPGTREFPDEHFTVVVGSVGVDVWAEIRRQKP